MMPTIRNPRLHNIKKELQQLGHQPQEETYDTAQQEHQPKHTSDDPDHGSVDCDVDDDDDDHDVDHNVDGDDDGDGDGHDKDDYDHDDDDNDDGYDGDDADDDDGEDDGDDGCYHGARAIIIIITIKVSLLSLLIDYYHQTVTII